MSPVSFDLRAYWLGFGLAYALAAAFNNSRAANTMCAAIVLVVGLLVAVWFPRKATP